MANAFGYLTSNYVSGHFFPYEVTIGFRYLPKLNTGIFVILYQALIIKKRCVLQNQTCYYCRDQVPKINCIGCHFIGT